MAPSFHRRRNRQRSVVRHNVTAAETTSNLSYQEHSSLRRLNIAVCLVGQFIRHGRLDMDIRTKFGSRRNAYTAFLTTSTQHGETEPNDLVDEVAECNALLERGFTSCVPNLLPYNATHFVHQSDKLEFQTNNGLFPFRTASLFSTISRCIRDVRIHSDKLILSGNASLQSPDSTSAFDAIIVTRMDTINHISRVGITEGKIADSLLDINGADWWDRALSYDVVGEKRMPELIDDRGFFGRTEAMLCFEFLIDQFQHLFTDRTNSPERLLYAFLRSASPRQKKVLRIGKAEKVSW